MNSVAMMHPEMSIGFVSSEKLDIVWNDVSIIITEELNKIKRPELNILDVYNSLMTKRSWLVLITENNKVIGVLVCTQSDYPQKRIMFIHICVGSGIEKYKLYILDFLKEGARNIGASEIEWRGRKGFEKIFQGLATFKHLALTIEVD